MKNRCGLFIALGMCSLLAIPANAQTIYRCGNSYSQTPCPGGSTFEASDSRDKAQKAQTDAAIKRDMKAAGAMEKHRTRQDAARARTTRPHSEASDYDMPLQEATTEHTYDGGKKTRKSEFFTAKTMGEPLPRKKVPASGQVSPGSGKPGDAKP